MVSPVMTSFVRNRKVTSKYWTHPIGRSGICTIAALDKVQPLSTTDILFISLVRGCELSGQGQVRQPFRDSPGERLAVAHCNRLKDDVAVYVRRWCNTSTDYLIASEGCSLRMES